MSIYRRYACQKEIEEFGPILQRSGNLALTGLYSIGMRTIASYIGLSVKNAYKLVIEDEFALDVKTIKKKIQDTNGSILIILPTYSQKDEAFKKDFQKFLQDYTGKRITTLIAISLEEYLSLDKSFQYSTKPITTIGIIKPRVRNEIFEIIKEFDFLNFSIKQKNAIYKISGGIPGLMKRCCINYVTNKSLSIQSLLKDETTRLILANLSKEYKLLDQQQRLAFGLIDEKGNIRSKLLEEYIRLESNSSSINLVEKITKIFLNSKGVLVSNEKLDALLAEQNTFSLWNRYKVIERVKAKLPKNNKLVNVRGKGYKLVNG